MFNNLLKYARENLSHAEMNNANHYFLGALQSQMEFSKNGMLSVNKVISSFEEAVNDQIQQRN